MPFSSASGALIQIRDTDYDYVDSQLLLQDIAYYPLGHPSMEAHGISVQDNSRTSVADILASLLGHTSEGED